MKAYGKRLLLLSSMKRKKTLVLKEEEATYKPCKILTLISNVD